VSNCRSPVEHTVFELAIVIVNFRTAALTEDCLRSLESEIGPRMRVVVVDNASGDGSAERLERVMEERGWSRWARLIRSSQNGGFAAGNNLGIRSIRAGAYLLLNSDTLVRPGALAGLLEAARDRPDAGIIGPGLLDGRGEFDQSFFRQPAPASEFIRSSNTGLVARWLSRFDLILPRTERPLEVDWLGFACVLIRASVIDRVGLLDEGYFMYFEDIDYCRRVRAAGWNVLYWPEPKVVHLQGGSSKVSSAGAAQRRAPRYYYEARARYFAKFYGRRGLWLANALWCAGQCVSLPRALLGKQRRSPREHEAFDLWTNALNPLREEPSP
jgi:N-acetylglucosaminyl-diphospho-decaprenol L-rhamnosyltransferase